MVFWKQNKLFPFCPRGQIYQNSVGIIMTPYIDKSKYKSVSAIAGTKTRFNQMAALAEQGEVQAASVLGEALLKGVWDEEEMIADINKGRFFHAPQSPTQKDHYLIHKRDPIRAVSLLKMAADYEPGCKLHEVQRARSLLVYMQAESLAGLKPGEVTYKNVKSLSTDDREMLKGCAKNSAVESDVFVPVQDVRPTPEHPSAKYFQAFAIRVRNRSFYQCGISFVSTLLLLFARKDWLSFLPVFGLLLLYPISLGGFGYFFHAYGVQKKMPMCSCNTIQESYNKVAQTLPYFWKKYANPFETTPWFIRNLHKIKQFMFWSLMIAAISFSIFTGSYLSQVVPNYAMDKLGGIIVFACILVAVNSLVITVWGKRFPVIISRFIFLIITFVAFFHFLFTDADCEWELETEIEETTATESKESNPQAKHKNVQHPHGSYPTNVVSPFGKAPSHYRTTPKV